MDKLHNEIIAVILPPPRIRPGKRIRVTSVTRWRPLQKKQLEFCRIAIARTLMIMMVVVVVKGLFINGGKSDQKTFSDYSEIKILKACQKPFTMLVEEGTFISNHKGELLNSKNEWHQAKIIQTTTNVIQGGADVLRRRRGGRDQEVGGGGAGVQRPQGRAEAARPWGQ